MTDSPEPVDFMEWLDRTYRQRICATVRGKYPGFSEHDVEDVWAETLKDALKLGPGDNRGGEDHSGLLATIALRRACDYLRRNNKQKKLINVRAEEVQAKAASEERGGANWWDRLDPLEQGELRYQVNEAFGLLSPDEWLVLAVYCQHYPKIRWPTQLLALLNEEFPEVRRKGWTPADVRKLLDQARTIVHTYLDRKGYELDLGT